MYLTGFPLVVSLGRVIMHSQLGGGLGANLLHLLYLPGCLGLRDGGLAASFSCCCHKLTDWVETFALFLCLFVSSPAIGKSAAAAGGDQCVLQPFRADESQELHPYGCAQSPCSGNNHFL